jgi:hypothetical protein
LKASPGLLPTRRGRGRASLVAKLQKKPYWRKKGNDSSNLKAAVTICCIEIVLLLS